MASAKHNLTLLHSIVRAAIGTGLVAVGVCTVHSPAVLAAPLADHVSGDCNLSAASIDGLVTDMGSGNGSAFAAPQVDYIIVYTRDNPNHGQQLTAGTTPSYTGPIVCGNGTVPSADFVTSLATEPLNAAIGTSATPVTVTASEQSTVLQHVPVGDANLDNAQNRFCHTSANKNDCFRVTALPAPSPLTPPSAPSSDRTYGGCLLSTGTVESLKTNMASGGIPLATSKLDYLVVYTRANPNDGQLLIGLTPSYSGPVLCSNPATVAIEQVLDSTLVPPSVDLKGLNHATYLQYVASGEGASTEKKICHSAIPNVDCFLVKAATPPPTPSPTPTPTRTWTQNFDSSPSTGLELIYRKPESFNSGYGTGSAFVPEEADAGSTGKFLRLTTAASGQLNMIGFDKTNLAGFSKLVVDFDFRMNAEPDNASALRADGIGFAFLNTQSNPSTSLASPVSIYEDATTGVVEGSLLGYAKDSFQIGFDTYDNGKSDHGFNDDKNVNDFIRTNHISLFYNGEIIKDGVNPVIDGVNPIIYNPGFDLANGQFNRAHIEVVCGPVVPQIQGDPEEECKASLTVDPNKSGNPVEVFRGVTLPGMVSYNGRAVFGGRTGASWETHDIDNIAITITE